MPNAVSPVTLAMTADEFTLPSSAYATTPLQGTVNGSIAYASVWVFVPGSGTESIKFGFLGRDNVAREGTFVVTRNAWHKISYEAALGTGVTAPLLRIKATTGNPVVRLSWAVAGVRDFPLQERIAFAFPIHTKVHFAVIGEYATLLSKNPDQVNW